MNKLTLGIDIAKKKFDVALWREGKLKHTQVLQQQRRRVHRAATVAAATAGLIARFCAAMNPEPWLALPKHVRALVRRLEALIEMSQQERNRLEAASAVVAAHLQQHIA